MRAVRGGRIGLIFQEPMTALSVHYTVGNQIIEAMRAHSDISKAEARAARGGAAARGRHPAPRNADRRLSVPASAAACASASALRWRSPPIREILIADEPTTALDVTTQAQILALLRRLQRTKGVALMLITHDMGVIAQMADDVAVMYLGRMVEFAPVARAVRRTRSIPTPARCCARCRIMRADAARAAGDHRRRGAASRRAPGRLPVSSALSGDHQRPLRDRGAAGNPARPARRELLSCRGRSTGACGGARMNVLEVDGLSKAFPDQERAAAARDRPGARRPGCQFPRSPAARRWRWSARAAAARPPCRAASCAHCRRPRARSAFRPQPAAPSTWRRCRGARCGRCGVTSR